MPILLSFQNNDELLRLLICNSRGFYVTISVHQRQYYSEVVKAGEVTHDFKKDIIQINDNGYGSICPIRM